MVLLTSKLQGMGYRRLGLALGPRQDERVNHRWTAAFQAGGGLFPFEQKVSEFVTGDWNQDGFARWFERHEPDVVITSTAHDVAAWLAVLGLRTPRDVGLASVHLEPGDKRTTGIEQNSPLLAAAAVDLLVSLMRHNERGLPAVPRTVMVDGTFVAGRTTVRQQARR